MPLERVPLEPVPLGVRCGRLPLWHDRSVTSETSVTSRLGRPRPAPLWRIAGAIVVLGVAVAGAAQLGTVALLIVVVLMQAVLLIGWRAVADPPSPRGVIATAVATAAAADILAAFRAPASLTPLAVVIAFAVLVTIMVQLARGVARARVTEAMAASLGAALGAVSVATLLVLLRREGGPEAVTAVALAAGIAVLTARSADRVLPVPHVAPGVERGGLGIILGSMTGTAATVFYASTVTSLTPRTGALLGWAVALVAVLADLAASYALIAAPARPAYSFAVGPLLALTAAAPVAYLLSLVMVR